MSECIRGKVSRTGRVVLPAQLRKEFGIKAGDTVIFRRAEYGISVTTLDQAIRRAQDRVGRHLPDAVSLVAELRQARTRDSTLA